MKEKLKSRLQRQIDTWVANIVPRGVTLEMPTPTALKDCTAFWQASEFLYWNETPYGAEIAEGDLLVRFHHTYARESLVSNNILIYPIKRNEEGRLFCTYDPFVVMPAVFSAAFDRLFKLHTGGTAFPFILYKPKPEVQVRADEEKTAIESPPFVVFRLNCNAPEGGYPSEAVTKNAKQLKIKI